MCVLPLLPFPHSLLSPYGIIPQVSIPFPVRFPTFVFRNSFQHTNRVILLSRTVRGLPLGPCARNTLHSRTVSSLYFKSVSESMPKCSVHWTPEWFSSHMVPSVISVSHEPSLDHGNRSGKSCPIMCHGKCLLLGVSLSHQHFLPPCPTTTSHITTLTFGKRSHPRL